MVDVAVRENGSGRPGRVFYVGSASGGVWKTTNGGTTFKPVFDNQSTISVGDLALAPSNPNIVWVGTGEANNSRSSSWGDGVYKSEDGGETWTNMGLRTSQHIGRIIVHPTDANIVYVAALGPLWGPGGERGLFKTTDGGRRWHPILTFGAHTGVTDIAMDPGNPDVLYAAAFERERKAYGSILGGPESGLYKSTDAGASWTRLRAGLPKGDMGRIGIAISHSHPSVIYATIDAMGKEGGVYRSDDYGASWRQVNGLRGLHVFGFYNGQIRVDPTDPDRVYLLGVLLYKSEDGGATFTAIQGGHADFHALWIDPTDTDHLIIGNDGGVYLSSDRGKTATFVENLPLAQYYAVGVDMREPFYYVYGGLQDNGSYAGPSATRNASGITSADWVRTTGSDGAYSVPDPTDPNTLYAESQVGSVLRVDGRTGERKDIKPYPRFGEPAYRWNWIAPILLSRHDHNTVYFGSNRLFRSTTRGDSWVILGGDMTRHLNRDSIPLMGKVWTKGVGLQAGVAQYGNISTIDESPLQAGVLWVGSDDGLVHVSRDSGATWAAFDRFPGVPERTYVSRVVASAHDGATAYVTFDAHRNNDFHPYVLRTTDYGRTWHSIASNLPPGGSVYVLREDPVNASLLFVGTEFGVFYTLDGGGRWSPLRSGMPTISVRDMVIHPRDHDLVAATHGRGIFILDDITVLERLAEAHRAKGVVLFPVRAVTGFTPSRSHPVFGSQSFAAPNPPFGALITYYVNDSLPAGTHLSLRVVDSTGSQVRSLSAPSTRGVHRVVWDLRIPTPTPDSTAHGPRVLPGHYIARLSTVTNDSVTSSQEMQIEVRPDPEVALAAADLASTNAFRTRTARLRDRVDAAIRSAEDAHAAVNEALAMLRKYPAPDSVSRMAAHADSELVGILDSLRGHRDTTGVDPESPDPAHYTPSIQERVGTVSRAIDGVTSLPTAVQRETIEVAEAALRKQVERLKTVREGDLAKLNAGLDASGVPWTAGRKLNVGP